MIQDSSMAVTFHSKITLRPGSVFCFGTISSIADEEGTLHRIADPPKRNLLQQTPKIPEKRILQLSEKRSPSENQGPRAR
jgi:hypothetical protein